jgi:cob(I)alamin adenosyltransferase
VDELQSLLGMARAFCDAEDMAAILKKVQVDLFSIGAELASEEGEATLRKRIAAQDVVYLEERIDQTVEIYGMPSGFVVPGEGPGSGATHVARAVCRRCERLMVSFFREEGGRDVLLSYMNRLGDLLFMVAWALEVRFAAKNALLEVMHGRTGGHR